jgi:16S rRNA (cytosine1402-N4)-methyltransferase
MLRQRLKSAGKAVKASVAEVQHNPRARSAVMRVAVRIK